MPAKLKGSVWWVEGAPGHYATRVRTASGSRRTVHFDPGLTEAEAEQAAIAAAIAARSSEKEGPAPPEPGPGETFAEYCDRWLKDRAERRQLKSVRDDRYRLNAHVLPTLGPSPVAAIAREHVEDLVTALDDKVRAGAISWKTASNTWGLVTQLFADACSSKERTLRARTDNPALGVRGPDRGRKKAKQYLWPSELLQLLVCADVPRPWRRLYAVAVYLYARAGELVGLTWDDVDLVHGTVHIHRAWNDRTGAFEEPKTAAGNRVVPIECELLPLLRAMHTEAKGTGPVFTIAWKRTGRPPAASADVTEPKGWAEILRAHLKNAGLERAALFASDAARKPLTFHDLRATGTTWCAVRGDTLSVLRARAGHETITTTDGYIREAENLRGAAFGDVFPALPAELIGQRLDSTPRGGGRSGPVGGRGGNAGRGSTAKGGDARAGRGFNSRSSHNENESSGAAMGAEGAPGCPIDVHSAPAPSPRAVLIGQLADAVRACALAGDLAAARVAAGALQALLVDPGGEPARVVDLASEREKRER